MTKKTGPQPAAMHPKVTRTLLDKLATDDAFRELFQKDATAALAQIGYAVPAGEGNGGVCLQLAAGESLASKESFARDRATMESRLGGLPFNFDCPPELKG
jgi:putative modified peptide